MFQRERSGDVALSVDIINAVSYRILTTHYSGEKHVLFSRVLGDTFLVWAIIILPSLVIWFLICNGVMIFLLTVGWEREGKKRVCVLEQVPGF